MTIKVVVGIIIWILSMLFIYMIYLVFVDPMFRYFFQILFKRL